MRPHGVVVGGVAPLPVRGGVEPRALVGEEAYQLLIDLLGPPARLGQALRADRDAPAQQLERPAAPPPAREAEGEDARAQRRAEQRGVQHRLRGQLVEREDERKYRRKGGKRDYNRKTGF